MDTYDKTTHCDDMSKLLIKATRPTLIFASDPMHFYTEFGQPFLLFNQQQYKLSTCRPVGIEIVPP